MKFYDENGKELERAGFPKDGSGRFLQDASDPDRYVWSPWATVPLRDEETAPTPDDQDPMYVAQSAMAQADYTAMLTDTVLESLITSQNDAAPKLHIGLSALSTFSRM